MPNSGAKSLIKYENEFTLVKIKYEVGAESTGSVNS
jgi:hypothetical protein